VLLVEEIKTRYSKVRELYRVADAVFSILGKAGRVEDDDLDLLEVAAGVLGDCWIDIYGAASFPPLLHQAVLHALEQGRRLKAFASVSESQGETLHASENALDARYGLSLNYEKLEILKEKFRVVKDSKVTKDILTRLLEETARGPKANYQAAKKAGDNKDSSRKEAVETCGKRLKVPVENTSSMEVDDVDIRGGDVR
jgi:hypothetical protein